MLKLNFDLEKQTKQAKQQIINQPKTNGYFNPNMNYYICSAGGCGSTIIFNYLSHFGKVYHIHDRYPPQKLCYIGGENTKNPVYNEWFNESEIPEDKLLFYKVIFIYRNPIQVIYSRFRQANRPNTEHLKHIKCRNNGNIRFEDVVQFKRDLYGLEEFYDNYTIPRERNYPIYCIKYEDFFNNISYFNKAIGIPDMPRLYPVKVEHSKRIMYAKELFMIYYSLLSKMSNMRFVECIVPVSSKEINEQNGENGQNELV
jgi:hypothetical protein